MENKTKWYRDPDVITKIIAVAFLVLLGCCIHFFAQDFFDKTLKLAISTDSLYRSNSKKKDNR